MLFFNFSTLQVIFATGALLNRFWLMEAGRFIFGWANYFATSLYTSVQFSVSLCMRATFPQPDINISDITALQH